VASVTVNPPKTPVTKGSNGVAMATVPNICKMPGPPAPFVPTPLPNIGKSALNPKGYSTTVKIEGNAVAIKGATFDSIGDVASKATGGGLISANTHGPTKFIGPGSMDVKIEGKNVQLLSDPMLNNCGPSGSPPNAATLNGLIQMFGGVVVVQEGKCPICQKSHGEFKESASTSKDADGIADAYEKILKKAAPGIDHGTMIGAVRCHCTQKKYADHSSGVFKEFVEAAKGFVVTPSEASIASGTQRPHKSERATQLGAVLQGQAGQKRAEQVLRHARYLQRQNKQGGPTAYPAGTCAGQGVLVAARCDGAVPVSMSEKWFSTKGKSVVGAMQYDQVAADGSVLKDMTTKEFVPGSSVPPCRTCDLIVPYLICKEEKLCHH
jgi:uncharacterized Zn-binding protein involved in type VI secretion